MQIDVLARPLVAVPHDDTRGRTLCLCRADKVDTTDRFLIARREMIHVSSWLGPLDAAGGCRSGAGRGVRADGEDGVRARAVQIVYFQRRGSRDIAHIRSAHTDADLELLRAVARQRLGGAGGEWGGAGGGEGHVLVRFRFGGPPAGLSGTQLCCAAGPHRVLEFLDRWPSVALPRVLGAVELA